MKCGVFLLFVALLLLVATAARADTDYRCLSICVNGGKSSATCLPQCTFNQPQKIVPTTPPGSGANHNVLKTPVPYAGTLLKPPAPKAVELKKDYACLNQCLQNGVRYEMCEGSCSTEATQGIDIVSANSDKRNLQGVEGAANNNQNKTALPLPDPGHINDGRRP